MRFSVMNTSVSAWFSLLILSIIPAHGQLTNENQLRADHSLRNATAAVIIEWARRPSPDSPPPPFLPANFGTRDELRNHMDCFDGEGGPSLGLLHYNFPPDFPFTAIEAVINVDDFLSVRWAARREHPSGNSVQIGQYWFTLLGDVFLAGRGVSLSVFQHPDQPDMWVSRVCGNFTLLTDHAITDTTVAVPDVRAVCGEQVFISAMLTLNSDYHPGMEGRILRFFVAGQHVGDAATGPDGWTSVPYVPSGAGTYPIHVEFGGHILPNGIVCLQPSSGDGRLVVSPRPTSLTCAGDSSGQYTDPTNLRAMLRDDDGNPLAGRTVGFILGNQSCSAQTDVSGVASCSLILTQPAGSYTLIATFSGDECNAESRVECPYEILRERAALECFTDGLVRCNPGSHLATVTLRARIAEERDGSFGDISAAPLYFVVTDQDGLARRFPASGFVYPTPVGPGVGDVSLPVQLPAGIYQVRVFLSDNGCYAAAPSPPCSLIVFCPEDGFVTGGGQIRLLNGGVGSFGFNVKYLPGDRLQGSLEYIDHSTGMNVHSISFAWLVITTTPRGKRANFFGTGRIRDTGQEVSLWVEVEDNGEPGTDDRFHIRLGNGYEAAGPLPEQNRLIRGNIQIHPSNPR